MSKNPYIDACNAVALIAKHKSIPITDAKALFMQEVVEETFPIFGKERNSFCGDVVHVPSSFLRRSDYVFELKNNGFYCSSTSSVVPGRITLKGQKDWIELKIKRNDFEKLWPSNSKLSPSARKKDDESSTRVAPTKDDLENEYKKHKDEKYQQTGRWPTLAEDWNDAGSWGKTRGLRRNRIRELRAACLPPAKERCGAPRKTCQK